MIEAEIGVEAPRIAADEDVVYAERFAGVVLPDHQAGIDDAHIVVKPEVVADGLAANDVVHARTLGCRHDAGRFGT